MIVKSAISNAGVAVVVIVTRGSHLLVGHFWRLASLHGLHVAPRVLPPDCDLNISHYIRAASYVDTTWAAGQPEQPLVSIESLDSPSGGGLAGAWGAAREGRDALPGPALADAAPAAGLGGAPAPHLAAMGPATLADVGRAPLQHAARCGACPAHGTQSVARLRGLACWAAVAGRMMLLRRVHARGVLMPRARLGLPRRTNEGELR